MIRIDCTVKHETPKAFLIVNDDQEFWIPKSLTELDRGPEGSAVLHVPEWLAIKRRII